VKWSLSWIVRTSFAHVSNVEAGQVGGIDKVKGKGLTIIETWACMRGGSVRRNSA